MLNSKNNFTFLLHKWPILNTHSSFQRWSICLNVKITSICSQELCRDKFNPICCDVTMHCGLCVCLSVLSFKRLAPSVKIEGSSVCPNKLISPSWQSWPHFKMAAGIYGKFTSVCKCSHCVLHNIQNKYTS